MPRRGLTKICALVLAAAALLAAAELSEARRAGRRVMDTAVEIGGDTSGVADPGNPEPFEPFTFAVLGAARGSHAAVERAVAEVRRRGGAAFYVLLGDVAADATEAGYLRLADALAGAEVPCMALPGSIDAARLDAFQAHVSSPRWYFVHRDCLFVGATGSRADDAEFVDGGGQAAGATQHAFRFRVSADEESGPSDTLFDSWRLRDSEDGEMVVELVHVSDRVRAERFTVSRTASFGSITRDLELGILYPLVGESTPAFVVALGVCAGLLGIAVTLARRPE